MEFSDGLWRKSSCSTDQTSCVEIAFLAAETVIGIRDSKSPAGGHLTLPHAALRQLTRSVSCG
jgi:hypothetical protein